MEIQARAMEIKAGKILGFPPSGSKLPEKLGPNEFLGLCVPYDTPSDSGEAIARGAIDCSGFFITMHEHSIPCGLAKLIETPEGIFAHGKLANNTTTSAQILLHMHQRKLAFGLCLSMTREQKEIRLFGERECVVTLRGRARELSICLVSGFPGCQISQAGPLEIKPSEWDKRFFPGGLQHLLWASSEYCQLYGKVRQREYEQFTEKNENGGQAYESFIDSLSF